jgi:hypothetical protein
MGLLRTLEMNQKQTARDASILWSVLEQWVRQVWNNPQTNEPGFKNNGQWTTAAKLHAELRGLANTLGVLREYERQIPNARSLAQNLKELSKDMASVVQMDTKVGNPANLYKFVLADHVLPQSEMVEGTLIA